MASTVCDTCGDYRRDPDGGTLATCRKGCGTTPRIVDGPMVHRGDCPALKDGECACGVLPAVEPDLDENDYVPFALKKRDDAPFSPETNAAVRVAARALRAAEDALLAARIAYGEAVKKLSEEAVK
jgi:hypothetical protein